MLTEEEEALSRKTFVLGLKLGIEELFLHCPRLSIGYAT